MIELEQRSPPRATKAILLIGPGAAGKSTLGRELAPLLNRRLFDLDDEFLLRIGRIDDVIRETGYEAYKIRNARLAHEIVAQAEGPMLLVTSSGFLTPDNPATALHANHNLLTKSYSICLLPSRDFERSVSVIVERQLGRPFSRGRAKEEHTIRERYPAYAVLGDLIVFSTAPSDKIARAIAAHLSE